MPIRKRESGRFLVQVELRGERRKKTVDGKVEAKRVESMMRQSLANGRPHLGLAEALRAYTATLRTRAKRATVRSAEYHGGELEELLGHTFNAAELRQADLDTVVGALRGKGWKDTSINGALRVLKAALRFAWREGKLDRQPFVRELTVRKPLVTILSPGDLEKLIGKAAPAAALAIQLAANAGLRHQEILHLTWEDVSLDGHPPQLRVAAKADWSPKNHADRTVPLNARLRATLAAVAGSGWLFPAGDGRRPLPDLAKPVREAFKAAGLWDPAVRPGLHMLRRTFASTLLDRGASLATVKKLGGWGSLAVVERYLASTDDSDRAAVALLEDD